MCDTRVRAHLRCGCALPSSPRRLLLLLYYWPRVRSCSVGAVAPCTMPIDCCCPPADAAKRSTTTTAVWCCSPPSTLRAPLPLPPGHFASEVSALRSVEVHPLYILLLLLCRCSLALSVSSLSSSGTKYSSTRSSVTPASVGGSHRGLLSLSTNAARIPAIKAGARLSTRTGAAW